MVEAGSEISPPLCLPQGPRPDWDRVGKVVFRHCWWLYRVLLCVGTGVGEGREQGRAVHPH